MEQLGIDKILLSGTMNTWRGLSTIDNPVLRLDVKAASDIVATSMQACGHKLSVKSTSRYLEWSLV